MILSFYYLLKANRLLLLMIKKCPLCDNSASLFYEENQRYFTCKVCHSIFVDENHLPDVQSEKERYELHDDNAEDAGYRKFVSPITSNIEKDFLNVARGLDFGAGTSQIITKVMQEKGFDISSYDPYSSLTKKKKFLAGLEWHLYLVR